MPEIETPEIETPEIDAVLFDAGGVLVLPAPAATAPVLRPFDAAADPAVLAQAHYRAAHSMDLARSEGTESDRAAYALGFVTGALVPPDRRAEAAVAFGAALDHWMWTHPVPGSRAALAALAARGVPIGVVSNAGGQIEADLARLGICRTVQGPAEAAGGVIVACVIDSQVVGVRKPDPAIFAGALEALGLPASSRVAYVGDTVFYDVRAAAAAGLTPFLFDPHGFHAAAPHPSGPHRRLDRLTDLLALV